MPVTVVIRPYVPADQPAVLALFRKNTPAWFSPEEEADLTHYLEHEREEYFVAEVDHQLVGCGGINFTDEGTVARLSWDMVDPAHHGTGIGRQLVQWRLKAIRVRPEIHRIIVRTSQMASPFYARLGFTLREIHPDYWARGFDLHLMEYTGKDVG